VNDTKEFQGILKNFERMTLAAEVIGSLVVAAVAYVVYKAVNNN
jgi:hypothetical protein